MLYMCLLVIPEGREGGQWSFGMCGSNLEKEGGFFQEVVECHATHSPIALTSAQPSPLWRLIDLQLRDG